MYHRYIDDILIVASKLNFKHRVEDLKSMYPGNIELTTDKLFELTNGDETNFLDMNLKMKKVALEVTEKQYNIELKTKNLIRYQYGYKIDSTLHQKPYTLFTYTHKNSNIPFSLKTGTIRGELIRRVKVCSTYEEYKKHVKVYLKRLERWGYSTKFLDKHVNFPKYHTRHKLIMKRSVKSSNSKKYKKTLFFVKKYNFILDNRRYLYYLLIKHFKAANMLKNYNIMICNKTGDNIATILQKNYYHK